MSLQDLADDNCSLAHSGPESSSTTRRITRQVVQSAGQPSTSHTALIGTPRTSRSQLMSIGPQTRPSHSADADSHVQQQQQNTPRTRPRQSRKQKKPLSQFERFQREYEKLAKDTGFMCPKTPFMRLVREILLDMSDDQLRITAQALQAIQTAAEYYVTKVLQDAYLLAIHAKRVTLLVRDIELLNFMRNNL